MSFALCLGAQSGIPVHAEHLSAEEACGQNDWSTEIEHLLSKGEYVEGQVVVGIDYSITDMPLFRSAYDAENINDMYPGDNGFEDSKVRDGVLVPVISGITLIHMAI